MSTSSKKVPKREAVQEAATVLTTKKRSRAAELAAMGAASEVSDTQVAHREFKQAVLNIRFTDPTMQRLQEFADKKGLPVSTLARMWLMERLGQEIPPGEERWV